MTGNKFNAGQTQTAYNPQSYSNSFGSYTPSGNGYTSTPSGDEAQGISSRQKLLNDLMPQLGVTSADQAAQINQYQNTLQNQITNQSLPQFTGEMMARGLGGSTAYGSGLSSLMSNAANQGILGANDLYNQALQRQLSTGQFAQSGLNDAYSRMMGIAQQGNQVNNQYQNWSEANANRLQQGNMANWQASQQQAQQMNQGLGQLAGIGMMGLTGGASGLGGLSSLFGMGGGGGTGGSINPMAFQQMAQMQSPSSSTAGLMGSFSNMGNSMSQNWNPNYGSSSLRFPSQWY